MSDPLSALAAEADAAAAAAAAADAAAAAAAASDTSAVVATAASNSSSSSGYATTTKEEDDVDDASVVIPASSSTSAAASPFPPPDTPSPEKKAEEAEEELFKSALDRDNEDLFTSAVSEIESEPPKVSDTDDIFKTEETHGNTEPPLEDVSLEQDQLPEIRLSSSVAPQDLEDVEEEEENPFKVGLFAYFRCQSQLQKSCGGEVLCSFLKTSACLQLQDAHLTPELQLSSGATAPSAGVVATNGTGASSLVDPEDFIRVKVRTKTKLLRPIHCPSSARRRTQTWSNIRFQASSTCLQNAPARASTAQLRPCHYLCWRCFLQRQKVHDNKRCKRPIE